MKKIILILSIIMLVVSCSKQEKVPGVVGQKVHLAAKTVVSESDTAGKHFQWQFSEKPVGSNLGVLDIQPDNEKFNVYFVPDVPGKYVLNCSIIKSDGTIAEEREVVCPVEPDTSGGETTTGSEPDTQDTATTEKKESDTGEMSPEYGFVKEDSGEEESEQEEEVSIQETQEAETKSTEGTAPKGEYTIQLTSRQNRSEAQNDLQKLSELDYNAYIEEKNFAETNETWYRVRLGAFSSYSEAKEAANQVQRKLENKGYTDFWVDNKKE